MGYITNSRSWYEPSLPTFNGRRGPRVATLGKVGTVIPVTPSSQVTTSWRTGGTLARLTEEQQYDRASGRNLHLRTGFMRDRYRRRFDTGHYFTTERRSSTWHNTQVSVEFSNSIGTTYTYSGPATPSDAGTNGVRYPDFSPVADGSLELIGSKLMNQCIPTDPEAGLMVMLAEMKSKLPSLIGLQTYRQGFNARTAGSEYLNVKFGIEPFKRDIESILKQLKNAKPILEQFRASADVPIRRRAELSLERTISDRGTRSGSLLLYNTGGTGYATLTDFYPSRGSSVTMTDVQSTRSWFSGAYTYHLAEADSFLGKLERYEQEMNHLLGTRFTIETLWELAPWSWLTDWFVDVGSFLGNLTALSSDRLVLRYGYVMNHQVATREHSLGGLVPKGTGPTRVANSFSIERKARRRATPYGFGLNVEQFSASRWAILGALGMTKSPRRLRGD